MHPLCSNARHGCCAWSGKVPTETHVIVIADEARMVIYVCNRETNVITGSFFFCCHFSSYGVAWCPSHSDTTKHVRSQEGLIMQGLWVQTKPSLREGLDSKPLGALGMG